MGAIPSVSIGVISGSAIYSKADSRVVERESYLLELCRYVVLNPIRAGIVPAPQDWSWSSYQATAGLRIALPWLDVAGVLSLFDVDLDTARHAYERFVVGGIGRPSPWSQITGQIFLGSPAFRERMAALVPERRPANVPRTQTDPTRLKADEIMTRVADVYGIPTTAVVARTHREAYQTAVWLLRRAANEPLNTVAVRFGVSVSRISKIQAAIESTPLTLQQRQAMEQCKVKQ